MKQFLESICCKDGVLLNLSYHQQRLDKVFQHFYPGHLPISLAVLTIPEEYQKGIYKCRLKYSHQILSLEFSSYAMRPINSLKLVEHNQIEYAHKYADRTTLNELFEKKSIADDVLIVKNGLLTDTTYANIALFDGIKWLTPVSPLLAGTRRAKLLDDGIIQLATIKKNDIGNFQCVRLFNAMIPFEEGPIISTKNIF